MPINRENIEILNSIYKQENAFGNWFNSFFSNDTIFDEVITYDDDKLDSLLSYKVNNLVQLGCSFRYLADLYDINTKKFEILISEDVQEALIYGTNYDFFVNSRIEDSGSSKIETLLNKNVLDFFKGMTKNGEFSKFSNTEVKFFMMEVNNGFEELYRISELIPDTQGELELYLSQIDELAYSNISDNLFHEVTQPIYDRMTHLFRITEPAEYWQEAYDIG